MRDTGIGMTKSELVNNLGTIARSGTTNFADALKGGNINLIGQFGVGFYSTFLAGKKVRVTSKSNKDDEHIWESEAASAFSVRKSEAPFLTRGTEVRIFLKEDSLEFLKTDKLEKLIRKYSSFIDFPIFLRKEVNEEGDREWQQVNTNKAIWLREPHEVEYEDYVQFYKTLAKKETAPLDWTHFRAEGQVDFKSILYIPKDVPQRFYSEYTKASSEIKLYVHRVLIKEGDK